MSHDHVDRESLLRQISSGALTGIGCVSAAGTIACSAARLPKPYAELVRGRTRLRFFHGDAIEILNALGAGSIDAIVTSPPYNLGIQYRSYDDGRPRSEYLEWTGDWIQAARRALARGRLPVPERRRQTEGSVDGARRGAGRPAAPASCRTSFTGSSRSRLKRRWPERRAGLADDLAVGHYKPINSKRFLNDCHEFVFHFSRTGDTPHRSAGRGREVSGQVERHALAAGRLGPALPRQHLVPAVRHHPEPRQGAAASRPPFRGGCRRTA